ncbi:MAG TPA: hypothetical protein VHQ39_08040 [Dongiaceae bacterium]|jgi:hypothetical protein|nr:hypothetical protein [Dongiaceae bacterium]
MDDTPETPAQPAPDDSEAVPAAPGPVHWIALVDADGVLTGFDKTDQSDGIRVPVDCALVPGEVHWDGKNFVAVEKMWGAIVDNDGVLLDFDRNRIYAEGVKTDFQGNKQVTVVKVPVGCDLTPGRYWWDGKAFHPRLHTFTASEINRPEDRTAIALALLAIRDGKPLPPYTKAWLAIFEKTFDAKAGPAAGGDAKGHD